MFQKSVHGLFKNIIQRSNRIRLPSSLLNQQPNTNNQYKIQKLIKPFLFTTTVCGVSFTVAQIVHYEIQQNRRNKYLSKIFSPWSQHPINQDPEWLAQVKRFWNSKREGFKIFAGIALINGLVFCCWHVPRFVPFMTKYFVSRVEPDRIRCLPMVLANFSHFSITHLAMNMIVLYSFSDLGCHLYGPENFLGLYFSAGVVSSFVSCFHKIILNVFTPSLGASGAILGILGATCLERPDIQLMIIFLPFFTFSSYTALKSILLMDAAGIILRWEFFDHAAHLGGTLFGMSYANTLKHYIIEKRAIILNIWKNFKSQF